MTDKIDRTLSEALKQSFANGLTEQTLDCFKKDAQKLVDSIYDDLIWRIKDEMAMHLTGHVTDMAIRAVEQMLSGNDDQMRRYLSCEKRDENGEYTGWTGRSDGVTWGRKRDIAEEHPVIHGQLFEQGALALRKEVAQANEKLIRDERILDLEDQIKSLVAQVNKANREKDAMWERLRDARIDA